ncbi:hypothetical protein E8E14_009580 [Neopestalotiopsis sp. 37M]|nr:hypothetical protein E8E14_009580 [Neopestalotiopsis sp. 37M]
MAYYYSSGTDYNYGPGDAVVRKVYRNLDRGGHHHRHHHGHHSSSSHRHHHSKIVNDGTLIVEADTLRTVNSHITNRPGATMYLTEQQYWATPASSSGSTTSSSYYYGSSSRPAYYSSSSLHTCRGCSWQRELIGGYCRDCIEYKTSPRIIEVKENRRVLGGPERRLLHYR